MMGCTVPGDSPSRVPWMNMVTSDLVRAETRMRLGHAPLNPVIHTALMSVEGLRRRLVLVVRTAFLLERILHLVVIMTLKLICFNGRLLMGHGPLGLIRDWMGCGTTRGCSIQIRLLDDDTLLSIGVDIWPGYCFAGSPEIIIISIKLSDEIYPHCRYISPWFCPFFLDIENFTKLYPIQ